jgi:hypothetical protein
MTSGLSVESWKLMDYNQCVFFLWTLNSMCVDAYASQRSPKEGSASGKRSRSLILQHSVGSVAHHLTVRSLLELLNRQ